MVLQRRAAAELRGGRRGAVRAGRARAESSFSVVQPLASGSYEHRPPKIAILSRNLPSWGTRCQKSKVAAAITPMTVGFYRGAPPWRALINDHGDRDEMGGFDPEIWEDMWIQQHEVGLKPMMS